MSKVERVKCPYCGELMRADLAETFISGKGVSFNDVCLNFKCKREVLVEIVPRAIVSKIEELDELGSVVDESEGGGRESVSYKGAKHFYEGVEGDELKRAQEDAREMLGIKVDGDGRYSEEGFNFETKVHSEDDDNVCSGGNSEDNDDDDLIGKTVCSLVDSSLQNALDGC